jgi:hypothetical protein
MPEYFEAVRARIMKGAMTYGDRSFSKAPADLIDELKQDALDLAGWGFVLFCRLEAMQEALEQAPIGSTEVGQNPAQNGSQRIPYRGPNVAAEPGANDAA